MLILQSKASLSFPFDNISYLMLSIMFLCALKRKQIDFATMKDHGLQLVFNFNLSVFLHRACSKEVVCMSHKPGEDAVCYKDPLLNIMKDRFKAAAKKYNILTQ